ncbi:MAG: ABC transporter ATP-binding protein [Nitrospiraceae bacterium]
MAEVRLEGLHKRIGSTVVIPDLSLTIRDGEFFTLVGPSGCGKSTLLHVIAGLDTPTAGRILFDGRDVTGLAPRERDIALVFQSYALYPHMTVAENLAFPLRVGPRTAGFDRTTIEREVRRVATLLGLASLLQRRPRELSGGQRQRVALGRALIRKPSVFLLDEPLSNLDAQLRAGMRAELRRLHDELRITMIYVTHDQTEAMTMADRLAVLDHGRIQQVGAPQDLYDTPANVFVAGFIGHPSMNTFAARIEDGEAVTGSIRLPIAPEAGDRHDAVTLGIRPEHLRVEPVKRPGAMREDERAIGKDGLVAIVRLIEPAGGQIWVTCEVEPTGRHVSGEAAAPNEAADVVTVVGLAGSGFNPRPGDRVILSFRDAVPHVFDGKTGVRVGAARNDSRPNPPVTSVVR